jgi:multidrug efflux pump subunit AcrA (membrane-fusion protein)
MAETSLPVASTPQKGRLFVKILLPLLILALAAAGFVILQKTKKQQPPKVAEERTWVVKTLPLDLSPHTPVIRLYGQVEAPRLSTLSAMINADVLEVNVREGQAVAAAEVLVRLDAREAELVLTQRRADVAESEALIAAEKHKYAHDQAALPREQALLDYAQKAVTRAQTLESRQVASQATLDEALQAVERQKLVLASRRLALTNHSAQLAQLQARHARAQALLELAQLDLERTVVRAPFAGIVSAVSIAPGERARVGAALISLYGQEELEIRAQIPQRWHTRIATLNAQGEILTARGENDLDLELARLSGTINPRSGGTDVLLRLRGQAQHLRQGQFLSLDLFLPAEEGLMALPYEAVYAGNYVYKLEKSADEAWRMRRIRIEHHGETQAPDGTPLLLARSNAWQSGDMLVASQLPNAMDGLKVTPEAVSQENSVSPKL